MDNLLIFEVIEKNIFIYAIDIDAEEFEAELARKNIGIYENTVKLLCYNNHIFYLKKSTTSSMPWMPNL